jgi:hypothetical protein
MYTHLDSVVVARSAFRRRLTLPGVVLGPRRRSRPKNFLFRRTDSTCPPRSGDTKSACRLDFIWLHVLFSPMKM